MDEPEAIDNPFEPPKKTGQNQAKLDESSNSGLDSDRNGNFLLTSRIIRASSIFCAVMGAFNIYPIIIDRRYFWFGDGLSWMKVWDMIDFLQILSLFVVAWLGWRYSNVLSKFARRKDIRLEQVAERQAYFWLGVGLMITLYLLTGAYVVFMRYFVVR